MSAIQAMEKETFEMESSYVRKIKELKEKISEEDSITTGLNSELFKVKTNLQEYEHDIAQI